MPRQSRSFLLLAALPAAIVVGCRENRVSYYQVPHEEPPPPPAMTAMGDGAAGLPPAARPAGPQLEWDKPAAWTEEAPSAMRLASYTAPAPDGEKVDVSVTSFPDAAGGLLANINRWRNQVGLPPVAEGDLETAAERTEIAGLVSWVVNFAGTPPGQERPERILGAIVPLQGSSWFFKMSGPDGAVTAQQPAFRDLLASMRAVTPGPGPSTTSAPAADDPHAGVDVSPAAMAGGAGAVPPPPSAAAFAHATPAGWQAQPTTPFRVVNFLIPGDGVPPAECYVTALAGAAGGELANVNRWRSQLGLPAISLADMNAAATTIAGPAGAFRIYDFASEGPVGAGGARTRILAAILQRGNTSWFFKMTGEANHVASQREAFESFLRSCTFPPDAR